MRPDQAFRRSVYLYVKRAFRFPFFEIFDAPDPAQSCSRRETTNVPPQALALLNNTFVHGQALIFAARLRRERPSGASAQIQFAWRLALGRVPVEAEEARAMAILARDPGTGLEQLCLGLFNLNEFLYID